MLRERFSGTKSLYEIAEITTNKAGTRSITLNTLAVNERPSLEQWSYAADIDSINEEEEWKRFGDVTLIDKKDLILYSYFKQLHPRYFELVEEL
jgi:hypothetical protein